MNVPRAAVKGRLSLGPYFANIASILCEWRTANNSLLLGLYFRVILVVDAELAAGRVLVAQWWCGSLKPIVVVIAEIRLPACGEARLRPIRRDRARILERLLRELDRTLAGMVFSPSH